MTHISDEEISVFAKEFANRRTFSAVSLHLLSGCPACRTRSALRLCGRADAEVTEVLRASAVRRAEARRAVVQWARLARMSQAERIGALRRGRIARYGLASHVLDQIEAAGYRRKLDQLGHHLNFCTSLIDELSVQTYGAGPIFDLQLRLNATFAHVKRLEQRFGDAFSSIRRGEAFVAKATDRLEIARFRRFESDLLFDLGRFEEAAKAASKATALYADDPKSLAKALMQEAAILGNIEPAEGVVRSRQCLDLLQGETTLFVKALQIASFCLIRNGQQGEARCLLDDHERAIREVTSNDSILETLFLWMEAYIEEADGHTQNAEDLYAFIAERFKKDGLFREMVLVDLDRLQLRIREGKWKSALNLASNLIPQLTDLSLRTDLLSMWAAIQDGLLNRTLDLSQVREFFLRHWLVPVSGGQKA